MAYTAAVITISDKGYRGEREDTSGPNLVKILTEKGFDVTYTAIVPDEAEMIQSELLKCADEKKIALVPPPAVPVSHPGILPRKPLWR